jgi:hypothetical protein
LGFEVGGGSEGKEVWGLELETGGGSGAANIGGGNVWRLSGTGGGVGRGTDVAVAGDSCDEVLLLKGSLLSLVADISLGVALFA